MLGLGGVRGGGGGGGGGGGDGGVRGGSVCGVVLVGALDTVAEIALTEVKPALWNAATERGAAMAVRMVARPATVVCSV